jgi:hypothetical protein
VDVLRRVLLQNCTRVIHAGGREVITRREKAPAGDGLPPGRTRIASPYDTGARRGAKRDTFWLGYKLHVTETCDDVPPCGCGLPGDPAGARSGRAPDCPAPALPNIITHVATTDATVTDNAMTGPIDDALAAKYLAPRVVSAALTDSSAFIDLGAASRRTGCPPGTPRPGLRLRRRARSRCHESRPPLPCVIASLICWPCWLPVTTIRFTAAFLEGSLVPTEAPCSRAPPTRPLPT